MKIEDAFPPEYHAHLKELGERADRASTRIQQEALADGDISGPRMVEIIMEECPGVSKRDAGLMVLAIVTELANAEAEDGAKNN